MALGAIVALLSHDVVGYPRGYSRMSKAFTVMLTNATYNELKVYCVEHNITRSEAIREFIAHGLECVNAQRAIESSNALDSNDC
jgi:hypothetical protein